MYTILLTVHLMITLALIGIILVQRSASDGMGLSGSSSNSFMSGRAAATLITRTTAVLATAFILTSLGIGIVTARTHMAGGSIMDSFQNKSTLSPATSMTPAATPASPARPAVPRPE